MNREQMVRDLARLVQIGLIRIDQIIDLSIREEVAAYVADKNKVTS